MAASAPPDTSHAVAVSVVVPCYNEVDGLPMLLERLVPLEALGWEIVFVDDGSADETFSELLAAARRHPQLRVVRHATNLGLGAAIRTGFRQARAPIVCTIDADCTYPPERLPELVRLVEDGADLATASAWHPASAPASGGFVRVALSRTVSGLYKVLIGQDVHTFTCLFRAYRRDLIDDVPFHADGFAAVAEIMLRAVLSGHPVRELPMPLGARRFGESKLKIGDAVVAHTMLLAMTATLVATQRARALVDGRRHAA